jgi:hypothetical protein
VPICSANPANGSNDCGENSAVFQENSPANTEADTANDEQQQSTRHEDDTRTAEKQKMMKSSTAAARQEPDTHAGIADRGAVQP